MRLSWNFMHWTCEMVYRVCSYHLAQNVESIKYITLGRCLDPMDTWCTLCTTYTLEVALFFFKVFFFFSFLFFRHWLRETLTYAQSNDCRFATFWIWKDVLNSHENSQCLEPAFALAIARDVNKFFLNCTRKQLMSQCSKYIAIFGVDMYFFQVSVLFGYAFHLLSIVLMPIHLWFVFLDGSTANRNAIYNFQELPIPFVFVATIKYWGITM